MNSSFIRRATNNLERAQTWRTLGLWPQIKAIFGSWMNVLLACVPVGIALHLAGTDPVAVFVVNFLAIAPLAGLLSYATEQIALRVGETLGGLLNASFGNAVEMIVSIIALTHDQIVIVQTSLIGSMLSNLLLVLGMCFFAGGIGRFEQTFDGNMAQTAGGLLVVAVGALIIPTAFHRLGPSLKTRHLEAEIPALSRGESVILLLTYASYLIFQLKSRKIACQESTHTDVTEAVDQQANASNDETSHPSEASCNDSSGTSGVSNITRNNPPEHGGEGEEKEQPEISVLVAVITLLTSTALIGIASEFMVSGIKAIVQRGSISSEFVGLILIPIVGNAAEHVTAVTVAMKDKMDLAIGVAVGSSLQIALLVLPLVVVVGWIIGKDQMTLEFDGFILSLLFVSVLLANFLILDGKSHWMEGQMLLTTYVIIALAAWFYPTF